MSSVINRRQWMKTGAAAAAGLSIGHAVIGAGVGAQALSAQSSASEKPLIRLGANENPYGPSEKARRAMLAALAEGNRYPNLVSDYGELEGLIAKREGLSPEHVVLGSGSGEILCMAGVAYGLDGAEILAADPTFQGLMRYAEGVGARVHRVPLNEKFEHDLESMDRRLTQAIRLVYVCNPNNPTGTIVEANGLRAFCEEASRRAVVLVDEAYSDYVDAPAFSSMVGMVRQGRNVIISRTFSKIHGLAGMRVGYALARPETAARLRQFRMGIINRVGLRGAIASYQDEEFVSFSKRKNIEARAFLYQAMKEQGLRSVPSQGNFVYLHVGLANRELPGALARRGVLITGGGAPLTGDWARITIGTMDEMKMFASALREVIKSAS